MRKYGAYASCDLGPEDDSAHLERLSKGKEKASELSEAAVSPTNPYASRQAPRRIRLEREAREKEELEREQLLGSSGQPEDLHTNLKGISPSKQLSQAIPQKTRRRSSLAHPDPVELPKLLKASRPPRKYSTSPVRTKTAANGYAKPAVLPLEVICHARTRVPTPHGEVFLHLYKNNRDDKEHLAFVFDREQLEQPRDSQVDVYGSLRSKSLDALWREGESDSERIVRGAYVGRLSSAHVVPSEAEHARQQASQIDEEALVRVHSECFTGETIGSQRCDCGEQLDEAFRLISTSPSGKGIIVYLRQEGRGIGLLEKIKAYNLQDLGHDTVTANILLGHNADLRSYGIAGEILRDLGVERVKLLTNNPDKIDSVEKEGIKVVERVPMVPRGWSVPTIEAKPSRKGKRSKESSTLGDIANASEGEAGSYEFPSAPGSEVSDEETSSGEESDGARQDLLISLNRTGVGMIGAGTTHSVELEKYLKTKIERMGHMLVVPNTPPSTPLERAVRKKPKPKKGGKRRSNLQDSVLSIMKTDEESVRCADKGCRECTEEAEGSVGTGASADAENDEVPLSAAAHLQAGIATQPNTPAAV